jgi:IS5 family transposase
MKLEVVTDATGLPLGMAVAAANVPEHKLLGPALASVPLPVPEGTPVIADKGHDCDDLRDELEAEGLVPVIPHRKGRVRPSRTDGRRLRRYRRRWVVERTHAWLQSYRGLAVRWSVYAFINVGLIYLGFIHLALQRL